MNNLLTYLTQLEEGVVARNDNIVRVGSLRLQFYPDHVFYIVKDGPDLSIYRDGSFKPPRSNEIYASEAVKHGVPSVFANLISKFLNTPRDQQERAIAWIVDSLENLYKTHVKESLINEVDAMRKLKITTEVDLEETEGLYNTTDDRWSRRAKHQLSKNEILNAADISDFSKGDHAVYEGKEVEVRIPVGPNGTAGIMLEGHLKMVKRSDLQVIEEGFGVMGAMKPLGPLNRIMQLAGLEHSGAVVETEVDEDEIIDEATEELDEANAAGTMFNQLLTANTNNPAYKNNPSAAKVATIGQVLAGLQGLMTDLPAGMPPATLNQLKMVPGIGANLIKTATAMTKPNSPMTNAPATKGVQVKK